MRITKLLGALALSGILAAGVAYAAATSSNPAAPAPQAEGDTPVTATWALPSNSSVAQITGEGFTATYATGSALTESGETSVVTNDVIEGSDPVDYSSFSASLFAMPTATAEEKDKPIANSELVFTITPDKGFTVKPENITFDIANVGFGDGRYQVSVNGNTVLGLTVPARSREPQKDGTVKGGDTRSAYTKSIDLSSVGQFKDPIVIKIHFFYRNAQTKNRTMAVANVDFKGTISSTGGETPVDPDPVDPGKPEVPAEYANWDIIGDGTTQFKPVTDGGQWSFNGTRYQKNDGEDAHVAYIKTNTSASVNFYCAKAGIYSATFNICSASNPATVTYQIKNDKGLVETSVTVPYNKEKGDFTVNFPKQISVGPKTLTVSFISDQTSWICNFHAPSFTWLEEGVASEVPAGYLEMPGVLIISKDYWTENGLTIEKPNTDNPNFGYASNGNYATARVYCSEEGTYSAKFNFYAYYGEGDMRLVLTDEATNKVEAETVYHVSAKGEADILLPSPVTVGKKTLKVSFENVVGSFCANFYAPVLSKVEVGEGVVSKVEINGRAAEASIVEALNANLSATETGKVYTTVPSVKATFDDDAVAEAVVSVANGNAVAEFTHPILTNKKFALTLEGVQVYNKTEVDQEYTLLYEDSGKDKPTAGNWSNGNYTLLGTSDGWGGKQFKLQINKTQEYTLEIPDNIIVKQLTFGALGDNYQDDGVFEAVTSEGANVIIPTDRGFLKGGNSAMTVLFENHVKGAPIKFTVGSTGQPYMNFQLVYERYVYTGEPTNTGKSQTPTDKKNHAVVTFSFDRPMQDCVAEYNGKTVKAYGGKNDLKFSLWDLEWGAETVLTIPAGAAKDVDGNANSEALTYTVNVAAEPTSVDPVAAEKFVYVTNVDELRAAVAEAIKVNTSADASRFVIYIANGEYELGSDVFFGPNNKGKDEWQSPSESAVCLHINKAYNVSLIGESRDGVIIKGERTGISNPIFSTRNSTNIYMENFTLLNYFDYGKERRGVAVCHYGGNRDIMVNILMQSQQDTQVTGAQGYYYNCEIHGSVDYVCGGGTHFYDHCVFVQQNAGAITAPSTSEALRHGYVFQNCEIKGTAGYTLGRPWQNNPSCHWLNTTMHSLPADNGWAEMGNLATRFYEFNSMDASGAALDLSGRKNSPTSTNTYNPVLTAEEAAEFTVENVLGGDDSWLATEEVVTEMTPSAGSEYLHKTEEGVETEEYWWLPVAKAAGYLVYNHDQFLEYVPGGQTSYNLLENPLPALSRAAENFSFTVRAMSPNGTLSAPTRAITPDYTTGVEGVTAEEAVEVMYYNLQGQPVAEGYRGAAIKVEVAADGTRTVTKTILD